MNIGIESYIGITTFIAVLEKFILGRTNDVECVEITKIILVKVDRKTLCFLSLQGHFRRHLSTRRSHCRSGHRAEQHLH